MSAKVKMNKVNLDKANKFIEEFERAIETPVTSKSKIYYTGVDLGTAALCLAVLDENFRPVAGAYEYASVVRDGMVVDYMGAIEIVKKLKAKLEKKLGIDELIYAATAIPPGTADIDGGAVKNVVMGAGLVLTNLLDEPTAANKVLGVENGAVVDIGGGTTGISILKDGEVVKTADEATGGTHFSLVLAGAKKIDFDTAEEYKRESKNHDEIIPIVKPTIEKVAAIIAEQIKGHDVGVIVLVGGTCLLKGIENIIEECVGTPCVKPKNPFFATPLGIALSCKDKEVAR